MQAITSTHATEIEFGSGNLAWGKFAALRHVTREMSLRGSTIPAIRRTSVAPMDALAVADVAEGAGLAHDVGNLLGALSLYSDLLAMPGVLHEEHREYASELRMLSDRSWAMIDRLVNHARAERLSKATTETSVLPDVVDRCRGLLSRVAGRTVEVSYGIGAFHPVPVAAEAVERILTNLVKNAAEATPWVGAISIHVDGVLEQAEKNQSDQASALRQGGNAVHRRVVMTVRDRGCGMDAASVRRLLQAGGMSSSSSRGLGFRVVRELAAISGGCVKIESQPEVGTSVSVEWYAATGQQEERQAGTGAQVAWAEADARKATRGAAGRIAC